MGFIHNTGSDLTFESRAESVRIGSERDADLYVPLTCNPGKVVQQIVDEMDKKAFELFKKDDTVGCNYYRDMVKMIKAMHFESFRPSSLEVSKAWLRELVKFCNENSELIKK